MIKCCEFKARANTCGIYRSRLVQALWEEAGKLQAEKERLEDEIRSKASAVFSKLDLDGNGWIDAMELKRFFRKIAGKASISIQGLLVGLPRMKDCVLMIVDACTLS